MPDATPRAFTPQDITRIAFVSDPRLAPDGKRIAFVVTALSEEKDEYLSAIWMTATAGGEPRRFTHGPRRDTSPRWSPDGARLAFLSSRGDQREPQLYVMPVDGGEPLRLTDLPRGVSDVAWSPDGTRLAVVANVGGWEEPKDEEEKKRSKPARTITVMKYKSNDDGWVHDRHAQIFVVPAAGGEARRITAGDFDHTDPAWSPDGRLIAYVAAAHENRDYDLAEDIWVVSAEGGEPRRLTDTAGPVTAPAFSADGATVAYLGHRHLNEAGRNMRVFTVPVAGGASRCLTESLDRTCAPFGGAIGVVWSPDGAWLTFVVEDQGDVPAYRVRADGSAAPERIIEGERQITGLSLVGATVAFTAMDAVTPAEVFVCAPDGSGERQLTDLNRAWKAEVARAAPERFRYERDGFTSTVG
ncbi:MAG: hypothetical protein U0531_12500 [Dehalococcoidia bacterium]